MAKRVEKWESDDGEFYDTQQEALEADDKYSLQQAEKTFCEIVSSYFCPSSETYNAVAFVTNREDLKRLRSCIGTILRTYEK
jgi:hypothetical protein